MKPTYSYKFLNRISNYIEEYEMISKKDIVICGLSGGADSVCLLLILKALKKNMDFDLRAVHVHHGIRGISADKDAEFCEELCRKLEIPFKAYFTDCIKLSKESGLGIEETGRNERYRIFREAAASQNVKIALAHHLNDQAETVLFNILRGAGLKGAGGIIPFVKRDNYYIIRPLLNTTKEEIIKYLEEEKTGYCVDETNYDSDITRNFLRNEVFSELEKQFPGIYTHFGNFSEEMREVNEIFEEKVMKLYDSCVLNDSEIIIDKIKDEKPVTVKNIIIQLLRRRIKNYKDITRIHIEDVYSLMKKETGKKIMLPYNIVVKKTKTGIVFSFDV